MNLSFSKTQNLIITRALTLLCSVSICAVVFLLLHFLAHFISAYQTILLPPVVALFLTMILRPLYERLYRRLWHSHAVALVAIGLIIFIPLSLLIYICGNLLVEQLVKLFHSFPQFLQWLSRMVSAHMPALMQFLQDRGILSLLEKFDPAELVKNESVLSLLGTTTSGISATAFSLGALLMNAVTTCLGWFVLPIYTALLLVMRPFGGNDIKELLVFTTVKTRENIAFLFDQFMDIVVSFFRGQVLVAFIQGILFGLGFQIMGLSYGLILGLILGLMNIVPYLGNIVGLTVTLPLALFAPGGGWFLLAKVLLVFCAVQSLDSYFITPRIMAQRTGLNSFVIIFSLFFWSAVIGGALGMVLAIPLSAFIVVFWRLLCRDYFGRE